MGDKKNKLAALFGKRSKRHATDGSPQRAHSVGAPVRKRSHTAGAIVTQRQHVVEPEPESKPTPPVAAEIDFATGCILSLRIRVQCDSSPVASSASVVGSDRQQSDCLQSTAVAALQQLRCHQPTERRADNEASALFTADSTVSDVIEQIALSRRLTGGCARFCLFVEQLDRWLPLHSTLRALGVRDGMTCQLHERQRLDEQTPADNRHALLPVRITAMADAGTSTFAVDADTTAWHLTAKLLRRYNNVGFYDNVKLPAPLELRLYRDELYHSDAAAAALLPEHGSVYAALLPSVRRGHAAALLFTLPADHTARQLSPSPPSSSSSPPPPSRTRALSRTASIKRMSWTRTSTQLISSSSSSSSLQQSVSGGDWSGRDDGGGTRKSKKRLSLLGYKKADETPPPALASAVVVVRVFNTDGVFGGDEARPFEFQRAAPLADAVRTLLRLYPVTADDAQFGFFEPLRGVWLPSCSSWDALAVHQGDVVELRKRYASYRVALPVDVDGDGLVCYQLDERVRVGELAQLLHANYASLLPAADYALYLPMDAEGELDDPNKTVAAYSYRVAQTLEYRARLQPLHVLVAGQRTTLLVDYLRPLSHAQDAFRRSFCHADVERLHLLKLGSMAVTPVSFDRSLMAQALPPPATLLLSVAGRRRVFGDASLSSDSISATDSPRDADSDADSDSDIVFDENGGVAAASLDALVRQLTHARHSDVQLQQLFLLTYPAFTDTRTVVRKLLQRFTAASRAPASASLVVKARVLNLLRKFVDEMFDELHSAGCLPALEAFLIESSSDTSTQHVHHSTCAKILSTIASNRNAPPPPPPPPPPPALTITVCDVERLHAWRVDERLFALPESEPARQITRVDFHIFRQLRLCEFLDQAWSRPATQPRCPTVMQLVERFNALASWVAYAVLEPSEPAARAGRFEALVRMAAALESLSNFHSLMAVLSGLNNAAVARLSATRTAVHRRELHKLDELEQLMNMEGSYARYRRALTNAQPPIVPYMGVYLGDLTFVEDGNPDYVDGRLINVAKHRLFFNTVKKIRTYQQDELSIDERADVVGLLAAPRFPDDFLYALSLAREPRCK